MSQNAVRRFHAVVMVGKDVVRDVVVDTMRTNAAVVSSLDSKVTYPLLAIASGIGVKLDFES